MNQLPKWLWLAVAGVVLALILGFGSIYTVSEREVAVVLEFGKPVANRTEPGLYFKVPLMQNVERYPKTLQFWRSSDQETLVDLPTADKKKIEVSAWAIWRITDPGKFRKVLVTVENAESAVKDRVRAAIRDEITSHNLSEVIRSSDRELTYSLQFAKPDLLDNGNPALDPNGNPPANKEDENLIRGDVPRNIQLGRETILQRIRENVQKRLQGEGESETQSGTDRGIELVDVGIYNISFVPAVREAAFDRLKTAMEAIAAKHYNEGVKKKNLILNETHAEVERITGEGEGESSSIRGKIDAEIIADYAKAINETGDFYNFERTLKLYRESLKGRSNRLILTTDTELFRLLKELDKASPPPTTPPASDEPPETT
ncbi:MAG: protease modulator HflC, partial [Planctomycetaceae bacterium]|nr:protease modulator HflC [Planctomycetaceae bacterium]